MGAETRVYCRVIKAVEAYVEVSAVTLDEARELAKREPQVVTVLEVSYDPIDPLDGDKESR
jgi:hypothetical protein